MQKETFQMDTAVAWGLLDLLSNLEAPAVGREPWSRVLTIDYQNWFKIKNEGKQVAMRQAGRQAQLFSFAFSLNLTDWIHNWWDKLVRVYTNSSLLETSTVCELRANHHTKVIFIKEKILNGSPRKHNFAAAFIDKIQVNTRKVIFLVISSKCLLYRLFLTVRNE